MTKRYSKELLEALHGDAAVLKYIKLCEDAFAAGDRNALFGVVTLCARYQAVIPEWAADALLRAEQDLESGALSDFYVACGWPGGICRGVQLARGAAGGGRPAGLGGSSLSAERRERRPPPGVFPPS